MCWALGIDSSSAAAPTRATPAVCKIGDMDDASGSCRTSETISPSSMSSPVKLAGPRVCESECRMPMAFSAEASCSMVALESARVPRTTAHAAADLVTVAPAGVDRALDAWTFAGSWFRSSDVEEIIPSRTGTTAMWQQESSPVSSGGGAGSSAPWSPIASGGPPAARPASLAELLFPSCMPGLLHERSLPPPCGMQDCSQSSAALARGLPSQPPSGAVATSGAQRRSRPLPQSQQDWTVEWERLMRELFRFHDLNGDGVLEELELVQLNKKIALLHAGDDANTADVAEHFRDLFRARLDPNGQPVSYEAFRKYMVETLNEMDSDEPSQLMILEQFVAEAESGHKLFRSMSMYSASDEPLLQSRTETPLAVETACALPIRSRSGSKPPLPTTTTTGTNCRVASSKSGCPSDRSEALSGGSTAQPEFQHTCDSDTDSDSEDCRYGL